MRLGHIITAPFILKYVTAELYTGRFCPSACELTLNYVTFNDTDAWLSRKVRACISGLRTTSLYLCFDQFCERETDINDWIQDQSPWCEEHAGVTLPTFHDVVDKWSSSEKAAVKRLSVEEAMNSTIQFDVTIPYTTFFHRAFTTLDAAFSQYDMHRVYGWYMYYFWIIVVTAGAAFRLVSLISNIKVEQPDYEAVLNPDLSPSRRHQTVLDTPRAWLKRYLIVPAAFGQHCSQPYRWGMVPPRIQSLTIILFIAYNMVLCTCTYRLTEGNLYWPQKSAQLLRLVSDRTGIISLANFPIVWLFGMRNDFLMWMTGWGFGTYNAFHRWTARIATLQAVIHSLGYTVMILASGGWSEFLTYMTKHYFWNGEIATVAMCALLVFSFYGIRRAHYEIFLITHIALSIAALWTMYYHVEIFTKGEWNVFIWPCVVIWAFDRLARTARMLAFNRNPFSTNATMRYDSDSNLVRMDTDSSNNLIAPRPGSYYYIHVLNDWVYAYQSHPFSLAYVSSEAASASSTPLSPLVSRAPFARTSTCSSNESGESDALLTSNSTSSASHLVFLIRPYDGFTSRLRSYCLLHPKKFRVLIEGPYGHELPLCTFSNILFVVGGTGIAVTTSYLSQLLSPSSCLEKVKIVWAIREFALLKNVLHDFRSLLSDARLEIEVHITRGDEAKDDVQSKEYKSVRIMTHRPDVRQTVQDAAQNAGKRSLAIVACGPALMADQARKASVEMLGQGHSGIEYFEESFKW